MSQNNASTSGVVKDYGAIGKDGTANMAPAAGEADDYRIMQDHDPEAGVSDALSSNFLEGLNFSLPDDIFKPDKADAVPRWAWVLFEIFLRGEIRDGTFKCDEWGSEIDVFEAMPDKDQAELKQKFIVQQSQVRVNQSQAYDDDCSGGIDCCATNRVQGYWNARGLYDCKWLCVSLKSLVVWYSTTAIPALWKMLIVLYGAVSGLVQLRIHYPLAIYIFYAVVMGYLVFLYGKWLLHLCQGGAKTWWADVSVERTSPGMTRPFSLDYWSMLWGGLLWLILDTTGGLKMLWTVATSACPMLVVATHCTLSSTQRSMPLGVAYIATGLVWYLLWLPSQMMYIKSRAGEEGRKVLGNINPNIGFMTNSIIVVFLVIVPEIAAFCYHENGLGLGILAAQGVIAAALLMEFAHIGAATMIFMGVAKLTADAGRSGFDEYQLCFGQGFGLLPAHFDITGTHF